MSANTTTPTTAGDSVGTRINHVVRRIGKGGLFVALILAVLFFQVTTNGVMLKPLNVTNVFLQNGYILVMALGMLLIIVIGHIDLSVGSVAGFLGAIAAVLMVELGIDPIIAILLTLIAGGLIGVFSGVWVAYLGVPSFS